MKIVAIVLGILLILCVITWFLFDLHIISPVTHHGTPKKIFSYGGGVLIIGVLLILWGIRKKDANKRKR